jgi:hypothetical protein
MEVSSSAALTHIERFMHPQAVIVDSSEAEEAFFLKALRAKAHTLGKTLIELPPDAEQSLLWMTRLNAASLKGW